MTVLKLPEHAQHVDLVMFMTSTACEVQVRNMTVRKIAEFATSQRLQLRTLYLNNRKIQYVLSYMLLNISPAKVFFRINFNERITEYSVYSFHYYYKCMQHQALEEETLLFF